MSHAFQASKAMKYEKNIYMWFFSGHDQDIVGLLEGHTGALIEKEKKEIASQMILLF